MDTQHGRQTIVFLTLFTLLAACSTPLTQPIAAPVSTEAPPANMANPASVYCEEQGNRLEIRTAADGNQSGVCIFPDGSECDEWAYFRGECGPASQEGPAASSTEIPTALPVDPTDYQGFWTYTHPVYNFSIMLPEDWVADETTANDPLLNGHLLKLHPRVQGEGMQAVEIRMTFRRVGEETLLWPTGVGAGEFVQQGTLDVAGQPARRMLFMCPTGQVNSIWYHGLEENQPNLQRGDLEFGFMLSLTGFYCEEGHSLGGKLQHVGELIIASLKVP